MDELSRRPKHRKNTYSTDGFLNRRTDGESQKSSGMLERRAVQPRLEKQAHSAPGAFGDDVVVEPHRARQPARDKHGQIELGASHSHHTHRRQRHHRTHHHAKKRGRGMRIFKQSVVAVSLLLLVGGAFIFGKAYLTARNILEGGGSAIFDENVDPSKLGVEGDGRVNILLLGLDNTPDPLTDTLIVASVDLIHKETGLVSIPRDLHVGPERDSWGRINASYKKAKNKALSSGLSESEAGEAGMKGLEQDVSKVLGIPIHYNVRVDWTGFEEAVDAVGGITIDVEDRLYERMYIEERRQNYILDVQPGKQKFDGFKALQYSRSRKTSPRGDFDRSERQREVLIALQEKIISLGTFANPWKVSELLSALGNNVRTNLNLDELMRLYEVSQKMTKQPVSLELVDPARPLLTTANIGGQSMVVPIAGDGNFSQIHSFIRNRFRDGFIRRENARIAILNGTNITGLADKSAQHLLSYGYWVAKVDSAPPSVRLNRTSLINLSGEEVKYTQHYLQKRFKTTALTRLPDGIEAEGYDFVIILGQNEQTRLRD